MKIFFCLLTLLALGLPISASEIDSLKTPAEVNGFLIKEFPAFADSMLLDEANIPKTKYGKNHFYTLDLDGNGLTDLLVDGPRFVAITTKADGKYDIHLIDRGFIGGTQTLTSIRQLGTTPLLVIRRYDSDSKSMDGKDTERTILFRFGEFIEYNPKPNKFNIEKVVFKEGGCFGDCPIFNMYVFRDRSVYYEAIKFNKQQGNFGTKLDEATYNRFVQTLNYIGLERLKSNYEVNWTDDAVADLEITYNGGNVKKIHDYGLIGTFGLANLYDQFFDLRDTQKWHSAGPRL